MTNRREFCALAGASLVSLSLASCKELPVPYQMREGRLSARPRERVKTSVSGQVKLDLERETFLYLPKTVSVMALPLLVMLHGATQNAEDMFWYLDNVPDETSVAVLAPKSRDTTWDAIGDGFGTDVEFLNRALNKVFETVAIDTTKLAIGGFSDGASYGLSLGLINGDLFNKIIAFSPGFLVQGPVNGQPRIFVSHGTDDHILPIDSCGRRISTELKAKGYDVTFKEFAGDHEIPKDVVREGLKFVST
jgi:phospholipase/carboxylesterase